MMHLSLNQLNKIMMVSNIKMMHMILVIIRMHRMLNKKTILILDVLFKLPIEMNGGQQTQQ